MPQILLAGAPTGCWTNLGDEAILAGMASSLRAAIPGVELAVVSSSPPGFLDAYGCAAVPFADVDAIARAVAESDLVLLGGGSIFFDYWGCDPETVLTPRHQGLALWTGIALLGAAYGTPVMVYGAGVGPLRTADGALLTGAAFELARTITLRDEDARRTLDGLVVDGRALDCVPAAVTGDPALGVALPSVDPPAGDHPVVGVALRHWDVDVDPARWTAEVAAALDRFLEETGGSAVFVPCHRGVAWPLSDDSGAGEAVRALMTHGDRTRTVDVETPWAERAALLGHCDLVLGMRYHSALFALAAGVPVVGLNYDPKVTGLLADWGAADMGVALEAVDRDRLAGLLRRAHDDHDALVERATATTEQLRTGEAGNPVRAAALVTDPGPRRLGGEAVGRLLERIAVDPEDRPPAARAALGHLRRRRGRLAAVPTPTRRPRVALLTNRLLDRDTGDPCIGGAERYALELARLLADLGLDPTFFQLGGEWREGDYFGFPVVPLPRGEPVAEFEVGVAEAFFERTADYDHVLYLAPNYAAGPMRDDAVVVCHGVWWDHDLWEHLTFRTPEWYEHLERVFGRAARVVSVDTNSINVVRALFPDAARRMTYVPNLVDTDRFHPPPAPRTDPVPTVLFPRRADVIRGPQLVGPVLDLLPDPCRVQWVGDGPLLAELHAVAARDPRLTVSSAAFDDMPAIYRGADICVIPTVGSEGQSLACLEAMASGCAVVATAVGGLPELIDDGVDGLLCEPTAESIADAVGRLVRDPALRRRLGAAAQARARRHSIVEWRTRWGDLLVDLGWVADATAATPYDIVCFSIIDWEFRWQRPQQMMDRWAERGRRVFTLRITDHLPPGGDPVSVTPLGEDIWEVRLAVPEGFDPLTGAQPEGATAAGLAALEALAERFGIERAVSVVEVAGWHPLASAARDVLGWPVVYDCMDDWSTFPGFAEQPHFLQIERDLVQTADVVVVSSGTIQDRWIEVRPDLLLARNAADFEFFHAALGDGAATSADPLPDIGGPIAGFFGAVVEWFDQDLVRHAALTRPDVTFVFVGDVRRVSVDALDALPNVRFLGPQPYETMPAYLRRFDVALVPFEVSPVTDGMDVVKLYEYLSQGTPVVTTPIREIVPYGDLLYLAATPDEFVAQLDRALAEDDPALVDRRIALARQHTWDERLDRIEERVRPHLARGARSERTVDRTRVLDLEADLARWQDAADHLNRELEAVHRSRAWKAANAGWQARRVAAGALRRVRDYRRPRGAPLSSDR